MLIIKVPQVYRYLISVINRKSSANIPTLELYSFKARYLVRTSIPSFLYSVIKLLLFIRSVLSSSAFLEAEPPVVYKHYKIRSSG